MTRSTSVGAPDTKEPPTVNQRTASSSHLHLVVDLPDIGICYPGATLQAAAHVKGARSYERLSLRLIGETQTTIMGKDRWQAATIINASMGNGAGAMPVSSFERHTFADEELSLAESAAPRAGISDSPARSGRTADEGGVISFTIPAVSELLPSLSRQEAARADHLPLDAAGGYVRWRLKLEGIRKGFLKSNDKLDLYLPVRFPSSPWCHAYDATVSVSKALKFEGGGNDAPTVEAQLNCQPPTTSGCPLAFTLVLHPSGASAARLLVSDAPTIKATAFLASQTRTAPIDNPSSGQDFAWAAVRIAQGQVERIESPAASDSKKTALVWQGSVTPPPGEATVDSKGLSIKYTLGCHLVSPIFAQGSLHISLPVFLASSPVVLDEPHVDSASVVEPQLPAYHP
ncbi:hypothetical protein JCM11641_004866 [Rhodosporidiobolus odoratus]